MVLKILSVHLCMPKHGPICTVMGSSSFDFDNILLLEFFEFDGFCMSIFHRIHFHLKFDLISTPGFKTRLYWVQNYFK